MNLTVVAEHFLDPDGAKAWETAYLYNLCSSFLWMLYVLLPVDGSLADT